MSEMSAALKIAEDAAHDHMEAEHKFAMACDRLQELLAKGKGQGQQRALARDLISECPV